jgi:hypothetical protein
MGKTWCPAAAEAQAVTAADLDVVWKRGVVVVRVM